MCALRVIQGHDGPVLIDEAKGTVTKIYLRCSHEEGVRKAEREVYCAARLRESLSRVDGVSCPQIIASELSVPPRVVMQLCPGEMLSSYLRRVGPRDGRIAGIAQRIHDGLEIYARLFEEPEYDCCFQNLLYDESSGVLTFLDFGLAPAIGGPEGSAFERILGKLVGWAFFDLVRPSHLFLPKQGYIDLMQAVLAAFERQVRRERIREFADLVFKRLGGTGPMLRRSYYHMAGKILIGSYRHQVRLNPATANPAGISDRNDAKRAKLAA